MSENIFALIGYFDPTIQYMTLKLNKTGYQVSKCCLMGIKGSYVCEIRRNK